MSDIHYQAYLSWSSVYVLATLFTCPTYMTRHVRHTLPGILILDQHTCPGDTVHLSDIHDQACPTYITRHTYPGPAYMSWRHCSHPTLFIRHARPAYMSWRHPGRHCSSPTLFISDMPRLAYCPGRHTCPG